MYYEEIESVLKKTNQIYVDCNVIPNDFRIGVLLTDNHFSIDCIDFDINEKLHKYNIQYLRMAKIWADNSFAIRNKVGSIMVKNGTIISDGFNGMPKNFPNSCEKDNITNVEVLHAEANCITKVAKSNNSSDGATLYCTLSPCIECAKLIIQSGIKEFIFCELYRNTEGLELLYNSGIIIRYYNLKLL
jgi:dCMP deaminase